MKIVLAKPYNLSDHIQPSLGLGYLATACRNRNHEPIIIDCIKEKLKVDNFICRISETKPQVVGFQCYTFDLRFVRKALEQCKKYNAEIITIIGGPHPSAAPKQCFDYFKESLDFIFVGEAEKGLILLLDRLEKKASIELAEIPGLVWRDNGEIRINPQIFIEDLDSLGMPAWDLIRPEEYPESQHGAFFKKFPIAPMILTRGCPYDCSFCVGNIISGKTIRKHSIDFTLRQLRYLYDTHKIREFHIVDDNFTIDKNYAKAFLKRLIDLKLDISLATPNGVRLDSLDEELLRLMKQGGLYLISVGIESGSNRILKLMKKNTTVEKIHDGINLIRKLDIDIAGFFIMGFPTETEEDIRKTINFSLELDLVRANYFTYLPFPGSESYNELISTGELDSVDWERFYFMNAAYTPQGLTRKRLKHLQRLAFFKFYFRINILWKNISGIRSFRHFLFLVKRFYHWLIMS